MSYKIKVRVPKYFSQFKCLAGDCRNTCCNMEWDVLVSRSEYSKLRNSEFSPETKAILDEVLKRRKTHSSDNDYAAITSGSSGTKYCALLDENRLCRLQLECGYSILTKVCKFYPRNLFAYAHDGESNAIAAISSSCEALVKLLMNNPDALDISDTEMDFASHSDIPLNSGFNPKDLKDYEIAKYFRPIHDLGVSILNMKQFDFSDRVILMGYAYQRLDEIAKNEKFDDIVPFMNKVSNPAYQGAILEALGSVEHSYERGVMSGVRHLMTLGDKAKLAGKNNNTYFAVLDSVLKRYIGDDFIVEEVDYVRTYSITYNIDRYRQDVALFDDYIAERPHILSNLWLNIFIEKGMPFYSLKVGIWENYMAFCHLCFLMKFMMVSALANAIDSGVDTREKQDLFVEDAVTVFSSNFLHVPHIAENVSSDFNKTGTNTLAHMALLIKS